MWNPAEIIEQLRAHLCSVEHSLQDQHAYTGLDALPETKLHPLLAQAFAASHCNTLREIRYPSAPNTLPKDTHRQRCDLVLIPANKSTLFDATDEQVAQNRAIGTLFEAHRQEVLLEPDQALPDESYWIEVKSVAQFSYVDGVPSANTKYTNDLLIGPRNDLVKLASDPLIRSGAVLVLLFHEEEAAGVHDLGVVGNAMVSQDLPMALPHIGVFPIADRGGNAWCTLGLFPVKF